MLAVTGPQPGDHTHTHTHGDAQRRRAARRSACAPSLSRTMAPAPAAQWLPLLTNMRHSPAPGCVAHKDTAPRASPVGPPVHTEVLIADGGATGSRLPGGTSVSDLPTSSASAVQLIPEKVGYAPTTPVLLGFRPLLPYG